MLGACWLETEGRWWVSVDMIGQVVWSHSLMVTWSMMLGVIVCQVGACRAPKNDELALFDTVADPVKTHVDGPGSLLSDVLVGDTCGCGVVGDDGRGWLRVSHFGGYGAKNCSFFAVGEQSTGFRFCGGCHNWFDYCGNGEYSAVVDFGLTRFVSKVEVASHSALGAARREAEVGEACGGLRPSLAGVRLAGACGVRACVPACVRACGRAWACAGRASA